MKDCDHKIREWIAMPSDDENGSNGYYQLRCCICGKMFDDKTYIPQLGMFVMDAIFDYCLTNKDAK